MALANEASDSDRTAMVGICNEIDLASGDGWVRIGYGEWPHEQGLQRFGRPQADEMVKYFKSTWNRIKRAIVGQPIFRGHPDHAAFANVHKDRAAYGHVADIEAREDGLYVRSVLSEAGADLVQKEGLRFISPHWLAKQLANEGGKKVFAPVYLVSLGLTDKPNIPGISLVNAAPDFSTMNKVLLIELLAALGNSLAADATDEQVNAALQAGAAAVNSLKQRPAPEALANEQTKLASVEARLTEAQTALANERTAHACALVDAAVKGGRILEASRSVWLKRLERDFPGESAALANETGALHTQPRTAALGSAKGGAAAMVEFEALVNAELPKHGGDWNAAWQAVKASEKGKALYSQASA